MTPRRREMDSNFQFLVASPSKGGRDSSLENESGSVAEPKVRIHLPPAESLRTLGPSLGSVLAHTSPPEDRAAAQGTPGL